MLHLAGRVVWNVLITHTVQWDRRIFRNSVHIAILHIILMAANVSDVRPAVLLLTEPNKRYILIDRVTIAQLDIIGMAPGASVARLWMMFRKVKSVHLVYC